MATRIGYDVTGGSHEGPVNFERFDIHGVMAGVECGIGEQSLTEGIGVVIGFRRFGGEMQGDREFGLFRQDVYSVLF